ncbi:unnamed protein product [Acanthoscelides obtectus]|uniref:Uncharacterized protein n=1 Tax=Acanthoscelides obtectus TaxID=200917 RepID=A0A9P0PCD3_ACAOB|nr:unnamed protein product [Acanthoscelides obtectus]CAK1647686.1 hypothetical protein AOBTE_LOCUS15340 [Acanthoscelides obtectus]
MDFGVQAWFRVSCVAVHSKSICFTIPLQFRIKCHPKKNYTVNFMNSGAVQREYHIVSGASRFAKYKVFGNLSLEKRKPVVAAHRSILLIDCCMMLYPVGRLFVGEYQQLQRNVKRKKSSYEGDMGYNPLHIICLKKNDGRPMPVIVVVPPKVAKQRATSLNSNTTYAAAAPSSNTNSDTSQCPKIHPNLAKDSVGLGGRSKETINRKWDELAICLNTHGSGATTNGQCWRRAAAEILKHLLKR